MSRRRCGGCAHWRRAPPLPGGKPVLFGFCGLDGNKSHSSYGCSSHEDSDPLGLAPAEMTWFLGNAWTPAGVELRALRQARREHPENPENQANLDAWLDAWRAR